MRAGLDDARDGDGVTGTTFAVRYFTPLIPGVSTPRLAMRRSVEVGAVARLDRAKDVDRRDVGAGEGAVVHDLLDARAGGGDLRGQIGQAARSIADHGGETREPSVRDEAALDHAAEDIGIDVAAAEEKDNALSRELGELPGKTGRERSGGGAFDNAFFQFDDAQNRERDLFLVHEHDLVGVPARDLESVASDLGNGEAVGQGRSRLDANRFPGLQGSGKTGDMVGFDRDDLGLRSQSLDRERDAGEQARAADRNDDRVEIRHLRDDFEAGACPARR